MRVLIAEGDKVFLDIAQDYLLHCGLEVNVATNGVEAVASLRRDRPDVVVLDRELLWGGEDGVRALMRQVPRLVGNSRDSDIDRRHAGGIRLRCRRTGRGAISKALSAEGLAGQSSRMRPE